MVPAPVLKPAVIKIFDHVLSKYKSGNYRIVLNKLGDHTDSLLAAEDCEICEHAVKPNELS